MLRVLALLTASLTLLATNAASPPVRVSLRSSWAAPPLLAEILETVSMENPDEDAFFTFLERLTDPEILPSPQKLTPEAIHQAALGIAVSHGLLPEPGSLEAVEMNLALHAATPKIEAFYNFYEDHHKDSKGTQCGSWVDWYGEVVCDAETLLRLAGRETLDPSAGALPIRPRPKTLTFDHIFPSTKDLLERPPHTAILYGSLTSPNFRELLTELLLLTNRLDPHIEYVFRHIPSHAETCNYLSGYGVALDLKKMDYLALDDRNSHSKRILETTDDESVDKPDPILALIQAHPENVTAPDAKEPLSPEELQGLGMQAAQIIAESPEPLKALSHLSQNFPMYTTALSRRVKVNESIITELHENSLKAQGGVNMFWLNGAAIEMKDTQPLSLLRLLKKERKTMSSLTALGLERSEAFDLLTHPEVGESQKGGAVVDGLFDASDRVEEGGIVVWWNDMEKDSRYAHWNPSLFVLLRPMYPGHFPNIKANLFNVILVLDLSRTSSVNFIAGAMANILERNIPLRFGLVPIVETEESAKMAKLFYHLVNTYGRKRTLTFLKTISQIQIPPQYQSSTVQWETVRTSFEELVNAEVAANPEATRFNFDTIVNADGDAPLEKIKAYVERLGATLASAPGGHAFLNGKHMDMNDDFLRQLQVETQQQQAFLQEKLYEGSLSDENKGDMATYFYDLPTTAKRRNKYIYPANNAPGSLKITNLPELLAKTRLRLEAGSYLYPESSSVPLSLYVVADLDDDSGLAMAMDAIRSITTTSRSRLTFLHNPTGPGTPAQSALSRFVAHLIYKGLLSEATPASLLRALGAEDVVDDSPSRDAVIRKLAGHVEPAEYEALVYDDYVKSTRHVARELGVQPGQSALVVNGRLVGPFEKGDTFHAADFIALEEYELTKRTGPVLKALESIRPSLAENKVEFSNIVSMSSSIIAAIQLPDPSEVGLFDAPQRPRQRAYQLLDSKYTAFEYGNNATALYHVAVLVDPLSETAQKWSSMLQWLSALPDIFIEVHLNPGRYTDIPLKRFYRNNLIPSLSFDDAGNEIPAQAVFEGLPIEPIYTLAMDVPHAWIVRPREALYDLDNIQLGNLSPGDSSVDAVFELDYIVVDGHARESATNAPPRGVQLELVTSDGSPIDDTQVVANLGYFQFKTKPGVFKLEIREGKGRKIYRMETVGNEGWNSPSVEDVGSEITLTSFEGLVLYPQLDRNPGTERADVLDDRIDDHESGPGNLFVDMSARLMSFFGGSKEKPVDALVPVKPQADINIFTVASGLLYERFVSIMIVSVLRNTNSTVKFWFIENFLSPSFLEFIPHMAEKYNFQYELVTYKWPSWLRAQTEKQRIIWAYKILFLDVLFPMDLKKVIFVDADQIVRADLKELVDLDLHGAPYGYTPMGDDNEDMEGFRFWKTGYWKEFLAGKPYHISALYVIDLVRFRQLAAGDILRGQYQALSADPNSLANLDQDLPNNIQTQVPIFSLHEDWLWCETWCSKDRLHRAKTIDLCQNPLTKEPKLARARQIPEWEEYDAEIARFARELAEEGKVQSRMAAADTNVLAGAAAVVAEKGEKGPEGVAEGLEELGLDHDEL